MKQVHIPFVPIMISAILQGKKTSTSRTKRYAKVGDWFEIHSNRYVITSVVKTSLSTVATQYYQQEGVTSPQEFMQLWKLIHPVRGFVPEQKVWLHLFKKV